MQYANDQTLHTKAVDLFSSHIFCYLGLFLMVLGSIFFPDQRTFCIAVSIPILFVSIRTQSAFNLISKCSFFLLSFNLNGLDFTDILFPFLLISGIIFKHIGVKNKLKTRMTILTSLFLISYALSNMLNFGINSLIFKFSINTIFFIYLQNYLIDKKNVSVFMKYALLGILVSSALAALSIVFSIQKLPIFMDYIRDNRYFALMGDPNVLSVISVPFLIWLIDEMVGRKILNYSKGIKLAIIFILLLQIIATQSRSGWLNLGFAITLYFILELLRRRFLSIIFAGFITIILGLGFFGLAIQFKITDQFISRAELIVKPDSSAEQERSDFFYTRSALAISAQQPFGLGTGQTERDPRMPKNADGTTLGAHNSYVQILSDNGWFTFVFFIAFLIQLLYISASKINDRTKPVSSQVLLASLVGLLLNGMFHDLILWTIAWIVPALIVAQSNSKYPRLKL